MCEDDNDDEERSTTQPVDTSVLRSISELVVLFPAVVRVERRSSTAVMESAKQPEWFPPSRDEGSYITGNDDHVIVKLH